jgi:hypothetical protein
VPRELWARLPMESKARLRGQESGSPVLIPEAVEAPDRAEVETGDVTYWPAKISMLSCLLGNPEAMRAYKEPVCNSSGSLAY